MEYHAVLVYLRCGVLRLESKFLSTRLERIRDNAKSLTVGNLEQHVRMTRLPVKFAPDDLVAQITSGAMRLPSYVEATYGTSILEWVRQTYDGRMDFGATTTTTVEDLIGRKPLTLREWVVRYRGSALAVGAQAAEGSLKE
jgi:hypothetical protein